MDKNKKKEKQKKKYEPPKITDLEGNVTYGQVCTSGTGAGDGCAAGNGG